MQKNSDQFEQLGTKIDPAMAEELNAVCDSLQVDIYHLPQWFCYTLHRRAASSGMVCAGRFFQRLKTETNHEDESIPNRCKNTCL